jgi:hypothetical protein
MSRLARARDQIRELAENPQEKVRPPNNAMKTQPPSSAAPNL